MQLHWIGQTADGWIEVRSRGVAKRYPNETCLLRLMTDLNGRDAY